MDHACWQFSQAQAGAECLAVDAKIIDRPALMQWKSWRLFQDDLFVANDFGFRVFRKKNHKVT